MKTIMDYTGKTYRVNVDKEILDTYPKIIDGSFSCISCKKLTSLKGAPEIVKGYFNCNSCNSLDTLEGAPKTADRGFYCGYCENLKDLKGAPEILEGDFFCSHCKNLETLEGAPRKCRKFMCKGCPKLKNLNQLLQCEIEEIRADKHLLEDFKKKKAIIEKHGFDKAMEIIEVMDKLI